MARLARTLHELGVLLLRAGGVRAGRAAELRGLEQAHGAALQPALARVCIAVPAQQGCASQPGAIVVDGEACPGERTRPKRHTKADFGLTAREALTRAEGKRRGRFGVCGFTLVRKQCCYISLMTSKHSAAWMCLLTHQGRPSTSLPGGTPRSRNCCTPRRTSASGLFALATQRPQICGRPCCLHASACEPHMLEQHAGCHGCPPQAACSPLPGRSRTTWHAVHDQRQAQPAPACGCACAPETACRTPSQTAGLRPQPGPARHNSAHRCRRGSMRRPQISAAQPRSCVFRPLPLKCNAIRVRHTSCKFFWQQRNHIWQQCGTASPR